MARASAIAAAAALSITGVGLVSTPSAHAATTYQLTIGPAGTVEYLAVNNKGDLLGVGGEPGAQGQTGFIQKAGTTTQGWLVALAGDPGNKTSTTVPLSMNNNTVAAGWRFPTGGLVNGQLDERDRPMTWAGPGAVGVDLGVDQGLGFDDQANGINDNGQAVGVQLGANSTKPWLVQNGAVTRLPTLSGNNAKANAINNNGLIVGSATVLNGPVNAVKWTNGQIASLGTLPGGGFAEAKAVNGSGQAVGVSSTTAGDLGVQHAVLFANGTVTDLNVRGTGIHNATAKAINTGGAIVGEDGAGHAFLYQNGQSTDLNTLIPANSGFTLNDATGINDSGEIVGLASPVNNPRQTVGFVLTPQ